MSEYVGLKQGKVHESHVISEHATCRFCGGKLLMSSQGWFHADDVKVKLRGDAE